MRTFFIVSILIGSVLGPFVHRTRQQMLVYRAFAQRGIGFQQSDPPYWTRYLPESWLEIADGQWFLTMDSVDLDASTRFSNTLMPPDEQVAFLNKHVKLLTKLSRLKKLEISGIDAQVDIEKLRPMVEEIAKISGLNEIVFSNYQPIDLDAMLAMFPVMPNLTALDLSEHGRLTNRGLAELDKFPALEELAFFSEQVNDDALKTLASMRSIKSIAAGPSRFSLAGLQNFANHPTLEQFDYATPCTDDMLNLFSTCPNMRMIVADESLITDEGLAHVGKLKRLESISLSQTCISDDGLAHLANCKELKSVECEGCKITDAVGQTFAQLSNLESMDLRDTLVTQNLLPQLRGLKRLREFNTSDLPVDVKHVLDFANEHPGLEQDDSFDWNKIAIRLGGVGYLKPREQEELNLPNIQGLAGQISQVRHLKEALDVQLQGSDVNDDDLLTLALTCNLRKVDLRGTPITPNGLKVLANQPLLSELHIGPFKDADAAMKVISTFPSLVDLEFVGIEQLTEEGTKHLLKMSSLESLDIRDCSFNELLARDLTKLPNLVHVKWLDKHGFRRSYKSRGKIEKEFSWIDSLPQCLKMNLLGSFDLDEIKVSSESDLMNLNRKTVKNLNASGIKLSRQAIVAISKMHDLRTLNLSNIGITNETVKPLGLLMQLNALDLSDNPVSDFSGQSLTSLLQRVSSLKLAGTQITNESLSPIMWSLRLGILDLSKTSLSKAWDLTPRQNQGGLGFVNFEGVLAVPDIIRGFASAPEYYPLPAQIQTRRGFGPTGDTLRVMFGRNPAATLTELDITPEVIQTWSIQELLKDKTYLDCLTIVETGQVGEILVISSDECPYLRQLVLVAERLQADQMRHLPASVRELYLKDCTLTPQAMEAIAKSSLIRRIYFDNCNLDGCSLEPLMRMKYLASVLCNSQQLSSDQQSMLTRLKPTLVEAVGW